MSDDSQSKYPIYKKQNMAIAQRASFFCEMTVI